ncbi:MAG: hypothetical protein ACM339_12765 [Ignavibacteria bacterium]
MKELIDSRESYEHIYSYYNCILLIGCDSVVNENNSFDYSIEQTKNCFVLKPETWVKLYVDADTIAAL